MKMDRRPTSTKAKREWNKRNYDRVQIMVPKGSREEIHAAAALHGMSLAEYIRHLILTDNPGRCPKLGGGGVYRQILTMIDDL